MVESGIPEARPEEVVFRVGRCMHAHANTPSYMLSDWSVADARLDEAVFSSSLNCYWDLVLAYS